MEVETTKEFLKKYGRLPEQIKKKAKKAVGFIQTNMSHPGLGAKRMGNSEVWEFRVDLHYRMRGREMEGKMVLEVVGMHDEGLGKK